MYQLQQVSHSRSCSTAFLVLWQGLSTCLCSVSLVFTLWSTQTVKFTILQFPFYSSFFFRSLSRGLVLKLRLGDIFVPQNTWEFCVIIVLFFFYFMRVFHTRVSCISNEIWVTASLYKFPGSFSVFQTFRSSRFFPRFPIFLVLFPSL